MGWRSVQSVVVWLQPQHTRRASEGGPACKDVHTRAAGGGLDWVKSSAITLSRSNSSQPVSLCYGVVWCAIMVRRKPV